MSFKSEQSVDNYIFFGAIHLFQSYTSLSELNISFRAVLNHVATKSNLSLTAASCSTEKLNGTLPPIGGRSSNMRQTRLI